MPPLATTRPLLCIVTDRRRLADAAGVSITDGGDLVLCQVEAAVEAGIPLVQIRERDLEACDLLKLVSRAVALARNSSTHILVNDRLDVALAAGASGVHLRESSFAAEAVKGLGPGLIIGRSVHSEAAARRAGPVDYLIAGSVFHTMSKGEQSSPIGVAGLAAIVRAAGATPVLAIGGIGPAEVPAIAAAGAAGVAAIGSFMPTRRVADVAEAVRDAAQAMRGAFGSRARNA